MARERKAKDQRKKALKPAERPWPEDEFDFMVAGVTFDARDRLIQRCLRTGDRVRIVSEPDNPHDEYAVAVTLVDGRKIGYVPRADSEDVSACIDDGNHYIATVKKILTGGHSAVPVIVLQFYHPDQLADIADLDPELCSTPSTLRTSLGCRPALGSSLWSLFLPLFLTSCSLSWWAGKRAYSAVASTVKWVASIKDDLRGEQGHEVHPASLIAKLLLIIAASAFLIILFVELLLRAFA